MNLKFNSKFKYQNLYKESLDLASLELVLFVPPFFLPRFKLLSMFY
jgi:hypothetical protein